MVKREQSVFARTKKKSNHFKNLLKNQRGERSVICFFHNLNEPDDVFNTL